MMPQWHVLPAARSADAELMDDPQCAEPVLRDNLRDLARINRLFGAHAFVRGYLDRILPVWRARAPSRVLTVLDVGTGGADVPASVVAWARRRGVRLRIVAVDRHPATVRLARAVVTGHPAITVLRADANALPFADASFDVCLCTLTLHHLNRDVGMALLRRLHGLSRIGFLAVDLLRSPSGYGAVWLLTRFSRHALIRHDGPLSVRRAMSWEEYRQFALDTGIPQLRLRRLPFFRVALSRM